MAATIATTTVSSPRSEPTNRRSTAAWRRPGFDSIASVTLLMKETLVRVAEPALVPAGPLAAEQEARVADQVERRPP